MMTRLKITRAVTIARSARVLQLEGYFDVPPGETAMQVWNVDLPLDAKPWAIGLIVGPSGSGKSTVAQEAFGDDVVRGYDWPVDAAVVDGFPAHLSIKEITALLSSVGFSSPPAWLKPFAVLSTGEQFRVTLARALAAQRPLTVMDEFTSVVDRRVAQLGSAALAKAVRRHGQQFIAVTCHTDVEAWLQPDWIYRPDLQQFAWRELQPRPPIALRLGRCDASEWQRFRAYHYLNTALVAGARCFLTEWEHDGHAEPVGFTAVLPMLGFAGRWREHRTVVLPEFQGVGIGMAQSALVGSLVRAATGGDYYSTTSHPAFVGARRRSPLWQVTKALGFQGAQRQGVRNLNAGGTAQGNRARPRGHPSFRMTATFRYIGPTAGRDIAVALWALRAKRKIHTRVASVHT